MQTEFAAPRRALEDGPAHAFRDWPATHFEIGPSGVYTVWHNELFLYVGMAWAHRDEANPGATGVFGRLRSHASGRRSGDQFAIYVCDRFVVPSLTPADMSALAGGERLLDARTRQYIANHLSYRVVTTQDGRAARALESLVRREGLPRSGRPQINP
jgi:hypothetical protein